MKWLKGLLIFVLAIVVLFSAGLIIVNIYKKEILAEISSQLKSAIHADITIGDADITLFNEFPNFTLRLENVMINDPSARPGDKELLSTKTILVNVLTYKLFFKEIEFRSVKIIDGEFFIFRTGSGYSNLDVFKKKDTTTTKSDSTKEFHLSHEKVRFENFRFTYHDSLRKKFIGFLLKNVESDISHWDSLVACKMSGSIDFERLLFNPDRGAFLKDKATHVSLSFNFYPDSLKLRLDPSMLSLNESEFEIEGMFDFGRERNIKLDISSTQLNFEEGLSVMPETIAQNLSILSVTRPFAIDVRLDAPMKPDTQPSVVVNFELKDNEFKSNVVTITDLSLKGTMTNHEDSTTEFNNANSTVRLEDIVGKIDELPFKAKAQLSDFNDLQLEVFSKHEMTLPLLNREVDTTSIRFTKGNFVSEFHYKGKLKEYFDQETGSYSGKLNGTASIEDGAFTLVTRKLNIKDIGMSLRFNEDTVWIDKLGIATGKSSAMLKGLIVNYVPYFTHPVRKGYVHLDISSPNLDFENFLVKRNANKRSKEAAKQDMKKVSDMLDRIFTNLTFDVNLNIDKLKSKTFVATKLKGNIKMNGKSLDAKNLKMSLGGGNLNMALSVANLEKDINPISVTAKATDIRIKDLFNSFNNFNQKSLTADNLEGLISFDTKLKVKINDDFHVMLPTLDGDVNMVVKNGRLINVEAMHNMSNFLFRKRDFDDVKFAQINGKCHITHRDVHVSRMEVQSTVLSIFLEGRYSLDNDTNLSIQVPLSNLKKRNKDFVPTNVGTDAKVGPSVFLVAKTDANGKTDIAYDGLKLKNTNSKPDPKGKKKKGKG